MPAGRDQQDLSLHSPRRAVNEDWLAPLPSGGSPPCWVPGRYFPSHRTQHQALTMQIRDCAPKRWVDCSYASTPKTQAERPFRGVGGDPSDAGGRHPFGLLAIFCLLSCLSFLLMYPPYMVRVCTCRFWVGKSTGVFLNLLWCGFLGRGVGAASAWGSRRPWEEGGAEASRPVGAPRTRKQAQTELLRVHRKMIWAHRRNGPGGPLWGPPQQDQAGGCDSPRQRAQPQTGDPEAPGVARLWLG